MSILPRDIITQVITPHLCDDPHTLLAMMKADPSLILAFKRLGFIEHQTYVTVAFCASRCPKTHLI